MRGLKAPFNCVYSVDTDKNEIYKPKHVSAIISSKDNKEALHIAYIINRALQPLLRFFPKKIEKINTIEYGTKFYPRCQSSGSAHASRASTHSDTRWLFPSNEQHSFYLLFWLSCHFWNSDFSYWYANILLLSLRSLMIELTNFIN